MGPTAGVGAPAGGTAVVGAPRRRVSPSASTRRDYEADWVRFGLWCAVMGLDALPADPTTVAAYLVHLAPVWRPATAADPREAVVRGEGRGDRGGEVCQRPGLAPGTLVRHLAAIASFHHTAGYSTPTRDPLVVEALSRTRRRAARSPRLVAPAVNDRIQAMVAGIDASGDPAAARDAALVLVGYTAALRRRELAALTLDQVQEDPAGRWIEVVATPADPGGAGTVTRVPAVGGPGCAVAAWACWRDWLDDCAVGPEGESGRVGGAAPAFRQVRKGGRDPGTGDGRTAACRRIGTEALTERSIARIVAVRAEAAGLLGSRAGRSLRQGLGLAEGRDVEVRLP